MDAFLAMLAAAWWFPYAVAAFLFLFACEVAGILLIMSRRAGLLRNIADDVAAIRRAQSPIRPDEVTRR